MQHSAALRASDSRDFDRISQAESYPHRRNFSDPLDHRLECALGRLRALNRISEAEYLAGVKWRNAYNAWINSIESPDEMSDDECEAAKVSYLRGLKILEARDPSQLVRRKWRAGAERYEAANISKRKRVVHAVNAIAVFDDPNGLGDPEFTLDAARIGLADLARWF